LGIAQVPEGRRIFSQLAVKDNLKLGQFTIKDSAEKKEEAGNANKQEATTAKKEEAAIVEKQEVAPKKEFKQVEQTKNQVLFTDYEMVQAETRWVRNTVPFNPAESTVISAFNNYFGGGMGSLVFQTIRESKALAYSTYGYYASPRKKTDKYYVLAYVGSQADKFKEAVEAMNELLNTMPELPANLELAKLQIKQEIETERITQDGIIYSYLAAQELGLKDDIRKQVYQNIDGITMKEIKTFHDKYLSKKPYTYVILASEKKLLKDERNIFKDYLFVGELSLDGEVKGVNGTINSVILAKEKGFNILGLALPHK